MNETTIVTLNKPTKKTSKRQLNLKQSYSGFSVLEQETNPTIHVTNASLLGAIYSSLEDVIGYSQIREFGRTFPVAFLWINLEALKDYFTDFFDLDDKKNTNSIACNSLLGALDTYAGHRAEIMAERIAAGRMEFLDLPYFFSAGKEICWSDDGRPMGGKIKRSKIVSSFFGSYFEIVTEILCYGTAGFTRGEATTYVNSYAGLMNLAEIPARILDDETRAVLQERGERYRRYHANGAAYVSYKGNIVQLDWWGNKTFRADGRVMLDRPTMQRVASAAWDRMTRLLPFSENADDDGGYTKRRRGAKADVGEIVGNDEMWKCVPQVFGFSFRAKQWGMMYIDQIEDISFREESFDKLVLGDEQKSMIRSLVENTKDSFSDIIEGKGGGCIFLLHGPPGQGKTLTAETVAELLHRPLYSISVGELGTDPTQLENRLREILDVATIWDAVLLLDEADIFLEARDTEDVLRNAMVGVFLRLLEYHQGVLFLTTNRVRNIDTAFYSRISVALAFGDADPSKRFKIWTNLLESANVRLSEQDIAILSNHDINGRQIKNAIRLTQTLAADRGVVPTLMDFEKIITLTTSFQKEIG